MDKTHPASRLLIPDSVDANQKVYKTKFPPHAHTPKGQISREGRNSKEGEKMERMKEEGGLYPVAHG